MGYIPLFKLTRGNPNIALNRILISPFYSGLTDDPRLSAIPIGRASCLDPTIAEFCLGLGIFLKDPLIMRVKDGLNIRHSPVSNFEIIFVKNLVELVLFGETLANKS